LNCRSNSILTDKGNKWRPAAVAGYWLAVEVVVGFKEGVGRGNRSIGVVAIDMLLLVCVAPERGTG